MALLSKACVYGLRASIYIALHKSNKSFTTISEVAKNLGLSPHFLTKILQQLTQTSIMESYRGPNGGVKLKKNPDLIKLIDIIISIDGDELFESCALGLNGCGTYDPCPIHNQWSMQRSQLKILFETENLGQLAQNITDSNSDSRLVDMIMKD